MHTRSIIFWSCQLSSDIGFAAVQGELRFGTAIELPGITQSSVVWRHMCGISINAPPCQYNPHHNTRLKLYFKLDRSQTVSPLLCPGCEGVGEVVGESDARKLHLSLGVLIDCPQIPHILISNHTRARNTYMVCDHLTAKRYLTYRACGEVTSILSILPFDFTSETQ